MHQEIIAYGSAVNAQIFDPRDHGVTITGTALADELVGTPYGDPKRVGGQHHVKLQAMPAFAGTLSEAEIAAVVKYEREKL